VAEVKTPLPMVVLDLDAMLGTFYRKQLLASSSVSAAPREVLMEYYDAGNVVAKDGTITIATSELVFSLPVV
jgi:hypothetical protein